MLTRIWTDSDIFEGYLFKVGRISSFYFFTSNNLDNSSKFFYSKTSVSFKNIYIFIYLNSGFIKFKIGLKIPIIFYLI